jgi:hypothetical protein
VIAPEYSDSNDRNEFYPKAANHMAEILERRGEPLLKGGTSYANIYAAGAGACSIWFLLRRTGKILEV